MVAGVETNEDRMTELEKKVNMLMKAIEERIMRLHLSRITLSRDTVESNHTHIIKNNDKGKTFLQKSQPQNSTSIATLSVSTVVRDDNKFHQNLIW